MVQTPHYLYTTLYDTFSLTLLSILFKSLSANGIIEKLATAALQKIQARSTYCLASIIYSESAKN